MLFEGEYLNGNKWNGKGYDAKNNLIYEIKDGKGLIKEYDSDNILLFEGEYVNGAKKGNAKKYDKDGKLRFDGEMFYGNKWNGKIYSPNKNIVCELEKEKGFIKKFKWYYEKVFGGEYINRKFNGEGKIYYKGNKIYEGEFLNGKKNGKGTVYFDNKLRFDGEYLYGYKIRGKEYINDKLEYEGIYICMIKNGKVKDMMKMKI